MQAADSLKDRDVFKASHDKQAEVIKNGAHTSTSNPTESAQVRRECNFTSRISFITLKAGIFLISGSLCQRHHSAASLVNRSA